MATNHIGHFLLVKMLLDRTKRVVMLAIGYENDGLEAYASSKLCNLLHVKEIARSHPDIEALAYSPGFTPDTQFMSSQPRILAALFTFFGRIFFPLVGVRVNSAKSAGEYLALMGTADSMAANGWRNGNYICVDRVEQESAQARDPALAKELWDKSEEWVKPFVQ